MKLRFKQECTDKNTNVLYRVGTIYKFEDERAKEILNTGYAEVVEEIKKPFESIEEECKDIEDRLNEGEIVDLYSLSKNELIKLAKEQDVSIRGSKEEIIERLLSN